MRCSRTSRLRAAAAMSESTRTRPRRLGLAALAVVALAAATAAPAAAQEWRTVTSARQVLDSGPHDVQIRYGAGELRLEPAASPMLYEMELRYDERYFTPLTEYDADARRLRLGVEGQARGRRVNVREGSRVTIGLSREVPMALQLQFGAGEAEIELGGISLRSLSLSTGASETRVRFSEPNPIQASSVSVDAGAASLEVSGLGNTGAERFNFQGGVGSTVLDFGGEWSRSATASVQMGLGSITLRVPRGLGLRVNRSSFLTSFDADGLTRQGNSYSSRDWQTATHRLEINVNAAFGSIRVEWID
jgi:hypothetical protein